MSDKKVEVTYEKVLSMISSVMIVKDFLIKLIDMEEEISKLVADKNHDYGDAWQRFGVFTPLIRINDKLLRVQTLVDGKEALIADEKIEDTLKDLIGYAALCLMWLNDDKQAFRADVLYSMPRLANYEELIGLEAKMKMLFDVPKGMDTIEIPPYSDKEVIDEAVDTLLNSMEDEFAENEMTGKSFDECCGDDKLVQ